MKNKWFFVSLTMVLVFGFVLSGCATDPMLAAEASVVSSGGEDKEEGEYAFPNFPKSISLSFSFPDSADERITKAQYDGAKKSGTEEYYETTNSDGTTFARFFSGEWRYWAWSGNGGEYGRMHYFEATENQFVEIVQALSLPSGWSVHTKVSDDKVSQIFLTPPSGPEYYYIEIFNPITYDASSVSVGKF